MIHISQELQVFLDKTANLKYQIIHSPYQKSPIKLNWTDLGIVNHQ